MIDTIVIRLHDLHKNAQIVKELELSSKKSQEVKTAVIDKDENERLDKMKYLTEKQKLDILVLGGSGEYLIRSKVNKIVNNSSHYELTYRIESTKDFLEFNFSIPKYLYGTNILMFTEHARDVSYKLYDNGQLQYNLNLVPSRLINFILNFLNRQFISKVDLHDVEINRIDVCYNQIFSTKEDALSYFSYQQKREKKYAREGEGGKTDYDTSFSYVTKRSSSKIYHKGTEYRKHDLREHLKINSRSGLEIFNTNKLQELSDRILRYELTIRNGELNYQFKRNIFRRGCSIFKMNKEDYLRIENKIKRNDRISKAIGQLKDEEKNLYKNLHPYEKISSSDRKMHRSVSRLMERRPKFLMRLYIDEQEYNLRSVNYECNSAQFSEELIALCLNKLISFIQEFEVKDLPNEEKLLLLIEDYNKKHKIRFDKARLFQFYQALIKFGSFREAANSLGIHRSSLYRYKEKFKKLGIKENNVFPEGEFKLQKPELSFVEYHAYLSKNRLTNKI